MAEDHRMTGVLFLEPVVWPCKYLSLMARCGLIFIFILLLVFFFFEGKFYGEEKGLWDIKSGFENIPEIKWCSTNLSVLLLITWLLIFSNLASYLPIASFRAQPRVRWKRRGGLRSKEPLKWSLKPAPVSRDTILHASLLLYFVLEVGARPSDIEYQLLKICLQKEKLKLSPNLFSIRRK